MNYPLEIKEIDKSVYNNELKAFLPEKIIDVHTHIWQHAPDRSSADPQNRLVTWPSLVAPKNPVEDHIESYRLMLPGKQVTPVVFANVIDKNTRVSFNNYVRDSSRICKLPALYFASPEMHAEDLRNCIVEGGFLGIKVYLSLSKSYIPVEEIRIFDFLPHHQLKLMDEMGLMVILHIPRNGRLNDPVNLAQMLEIEERYQNLKLIIAHVGRAYCKEDVGEAFEILSKTRRMYFDFSANTNAEVFEQLINAVGPDRILFGSDMPIVRMRMKRICENGHYVNIVPAGLYGDVSGDPNMREVEGPEADKLTFFLYEELLAFKKAAGKTGLGDNDIENIFYNNSKGVIDSASRNMESIR